MNCRDLGPKPCALAINSSRISHIIQRRKRLSEKQRRSERTRERERKRDREKEKEKFSNSSNASDVALFFFSTKLISFQIRKGLFDAVNMRSFQDEALRR